MTPMRGTFKISFYLILALAFSAPAFARTIPEIQAKFEECFNKTYIQHGQPWETAKFLCTESFKIAFEGQDTKFEILDNAPRGPRSFFVKLKITQGNRSYESFHAVGRSNGVECPTFKAPAPTAVLETLTNETVNCSDSTKKVSSPFGGMVDYNSFGFTRKPEGCVRVCPPGQVLVGGAGSSFACKNCWELAEDTTDSWDLRMMFTRRYRNKFTATNSTNNWCSDTTGCAQGSTYHGKNADGSPICHFPCLDPGKSRDSAGNCVDDNSYCQKLTKAVQTGIFWDRISLIPKIKIGTCSPDQVYAAASNYQSVIYSRVSDFENLCKKSVAAFKKVAATSAPGASGGMGMMPGTGSGDGPGYIKQFIAKRCGIEPYSAAIKKIPGGIPQFDSYEANKGMQILMFQ